MRDPQPTGGFEWVQEPWGSALRCTHVPVTHLFTSRDLTLRHAEDDWPRVAASLGVPRERLLLIRQVHGASVAVAKRGGTTAWQRPDADAIVTDDPDVAIGIVVADCAPILLFDPLKNVAAAVHAGWRGAVAAVAPAAVSTLKTTFGTRAADLVGAIGPCLGRCCGEVGPEVRVAFESAFPERARRWFTPGAGDRWILDLERANLEQLEAAGVDRSRVFSSGLCTKTHAGRLHSYRADRAGAGRSLGAIRIAR